MRIWIGKIAQLLLQGHFELHVDFLVITSSSWCIGPFPCGPDYTMIARSAIPSVKVGAVASKSW